MRVREVGAGASVEQLLDTSQISLGRSIVEVCAAKLVRFLHP